ncbi:translation initiation factor eIF-2B subunit epsilon-like [Papaver somniferum]|uniref:translation initiation factor eIF-2B subunit epsilon-like n=1 Tax=Papaver somniferum TaxID=3469 RepID=UPI000E701F5E|nr:translation initiation factor eIF-2B subunit epsilon-like [Papaver somniferum]
MAKKNQVRAAKKDADDQESHSPLQAILLANTTFDENNFQPITKERPKVLLPLVNTPMIDHSLAWLKSAGVEQVFIVVCDNGAHSEQIIDYLAHSGWSSLHNPKFTVKTIAPRGSVSAGDALRFIYELDVIRGDFILPSGDGDFILLSGDTVTNMPSLEKVLQEHKQRKEGDNNAIMTMLVINKSKHKTTLPVNPTPGNNDDDQLVMAIHPNTKELLYYDEDAADSNAAMVIALRNKGLVLDSPDDVKVHNDIEDFYIDVCSPEVLSLFADNFDYQQLRRDFVKGLLEDDVMIYKIFIHEIQSDYDTFRSYDSISKDIMQQSTYPLVPDVQFSGKRPIKLEIQGISKGSKRDGETSGSDSEDEEDFDTEVEATFLRLVHEGVDQKNTIIEVTSLRFAFNMETSDCARALFWSMMKFAYETPYGTEAELYRNAVSVITTWGDLLRHYVTSTDEQIEIIATLEEMCSEFAKDFAAMFHKILHVLYEKDIVTEEAILLWASEKQEADASDRIFVNQLQSLIQWLKEAEEED